MTVELIKDGNKFNIAYEENVVLKGIGIKDLIFILRSNTRSAAYLTLQTAVGILNEDADIDDIIRSLKAQYKDMIPKINKEKKAEEVLPDVTSWDQFETEINKLIRDRSEDFKFVLSVIASYWFIYADDDFCNYFLMLAPKAKGKSALLGGFTSSKEFVECVDNMTMEAWAPGTVDGKKTVGIADMVEGKTLMIHDVTSLFGNNEDKVKKILYDFEQSFGMEPFRKGMPGAINEFGGGWNGIFGIPPMLFRNNKLSFLQTSRFFVYQLTPINEREIIKGSVNRPKKTEIKKLCKAYLNHLNKNLVTVSIPPEVTDYIIDFLEVYVEYLKVYRHKGSSCYTYHDWESEGIIRRYNQVETLIKARCLVSGNYKPTVQDAKYWLSMLWFGDTMAEVKLKLEATNMNPEDYLEFIIPPV